MHAEMRMSQHLVAMKSLLFVLLLVQSNSSMTQGDNCSDTQLEAFQKQLDLSNSQVEHDCHLEVKETLIQLLDNAKSTVHVKGLLVKYLRKFNHILLVILHEAPTMINLA